MKKLIIILSLVILSSCERPSYVEGGDDIVLGEIHYKKDTRTGLCFAESGGGNSFTMTCVPCTEEVENLIKR